jgi:hypothetical protein
MVYFYVPKHRKEHVETTVYNLLRAWDNESN